MDSINPKHWDTKGKFMKELIAALVTIAVVIATSAVITTHL